MSDAAAAMPRTLHIHGSLARGDPQAERCVRLMSALGARLRHTLVAADGDYGVLDGIAKSISWRRAEEFPRIDGAPLPGRLQAVARAMGDHNLVLTYGVAGARAALAHTLFGELTGAPPLVHHEDGSDQTAAQRRSLRSTWLRRIGLGKASGLVVPTEVMEEVALAGWQQPMGRVKLIPDGADLKRLGGKTKAQGIGRLLKRGGEHWIGCFAGRGDDAGLTRLVDDLAGLNDDWHVVVIGEAAAGTAVSAAVARRKLDHRVHFVGAVADRAAALALCDIVVSPGGRELLPHAVVEAVAAGKPVAGLTPAIADEVLCADTMAAGDGLLGRLAGDPYLRDAIGKANRERAAAERDEAAMVASYRRLYASAMGRGSI